MPRFLYSYFQLLSYMGSGTPEDPGGDFSMSVWIDAPDEHAALVWGYRLLGDYYRARFQHAEDASHCDGRPIEEGYIEKDPEVLARAQAVYDYPAGRVNEVPNWREPWRDHNG